MKKGDYVKLYKVSDEVFNGVHPNGIDVGYTQYGTLVEDVTVGKRCDVVNYKRLHDYLSTSKVVEIINENLFRTENSTYRIEEVEESKKMDEGRVMINLDWIK